MTEDEGNEKNVIEQLDEEDIHDINLAATTIKRRSDGLLDFVKDYRTISNVPVPILKKVNVKKLLTEIELLMNSSISEAQIDFVVLPIPSNATINVDLKLIQQYINLLKASPISGVQQINYIVDSMQYISWRKHITQTK